MLIHYWRKATDRKLKACNLGKSGKIPCHSLFQDSSRYDEFVCSEDSLQLIRRWLNDAKSCKLSPSQIGEILRLNTAHFYAPKLLCPQYEYDALFQQFYRAQCPRCGKLPKEPLLCMFCGELICYRDSCCITNKLNEFEVKFPNRF